MGFSYGKYFERFGPLIEDTKISLYGYPETPGVLIRYELLRSMLMDQYRVVSHRNYTELPCSGKFIFNKAVMGEKLTPEEELFLKVRYKLIDAEIKGNTLQRSELSKIQKILIAGINCTLQLQLPERAESCLN